MEAVFSTVNLWLNNHSNAEVNDLMTRVLDSVPSFKFVCLGYQIFSRLGNKGPEGSSRGQEKTGTFNIALQKIVSLLCCEHPHHTLPLLFALAHEKV